MTASANGLERGPSNMATATPSAPTLPAAPTGVKATANGKRRITITWLASNGATGYNVKRSSTPGGAQTVVGSNVTSLSFTDTNVVSKSTYYYVVSAVNAAGESANSAQVSATAK